MVISILYTYASIQTSIEIVKLIDLKMGDQR